MRTKLYIRNIYTECLGQSHGGSLVVASVSAGPYEPRLLDCVRSPTVP